MDALLHCLLHQVRVRLLARCSCQMQQMRPPDHLLQTQVRGQLSQQPEQRMLAQQIQSQAQVQLASWAPRRIQAGQKDQPLRQPQQKARP